MILQLLASVMTNSKCIELYKFLQELDISIIKYTDNYGNLVIRGVVKSNSQEVINNMEKLKTMINAIKSQHKIFEKVKLELEIENKILQIGVYEK